MLILVLLAVLGWGGWWFIGARGQEAGVEAWLNQQRKQGWQAEAAAVEVTGFPTAYGLQVREIALADPRTGWAWEAPEWRADSTPWMPTRFALTWPDSQTVAVPGDRADISSEVMEAVIDFRPGPSMELRQIAGDISALVVAGQQGWRAGAAGAKLDLSERPADLAPPNSYDLRITAQDLVLPKQIVAQIDPTGWLKPKVDTFTVKAHGAFAEPIGRVTLEEGRMALRAGTVREAGFQWGDMRLTAKGSIEVDDDGFPVGDLRIEAQEWRQMVRLAQSSGIIDRDTAGTIIDAVEFLTALTGSGDSLSVSLGLSGGKVRIGPFAIANAPRLAPPR